MTDKPIETSTDAEPGSDAELSAAQVARYLLEHPEFFVEHESLLDHIKVPHESGQAVSLVARQVSLFREQRDEFRHQLNELVETARQNDRFFEKSKRLLMNMLEAQSLDDVMIVLEDSFRNDFQVEFCSLVLIGDQTHYPTSNVHVISTDAARRHLESLLETRRAVCGRFQSEQLQLLFPNSHERVGSAAVIPLRYGDTLGMLSIGSDDMNYFDSSMGSLFLSYISESLSRLLPPLLAQEQKAEAAAVKPKTKKS
jgi:uncharacterized protein